MKPDQILTLPQASIPALRWLTDPGPGVPPHIRSTLLGELFSSQAAVIMGVFAGLVVNGYAIHVHGGTAFPVILCLDIIVALVRFYVARHVAYSLAHGLSVPIDISLLTGLLWCMVQGAMAFTSVTSGIPALQILGGTTIVGLMGPICARNYAAPRWAFLLVFAVYLPFVAGALTTGAAWAYMVLLQGPAFVFGNFMIIKRFQTLAIANLLARHESNHIATHDMLTGLLNRSGLTAALANRDQTPSNVFILFYLDLDGFKAVNDTFGHQAGDRLLHEVADRLRAKAKPDDVIARLGGDEFVVIAAEMPPTEGSDFAESLIQAISEEPYSLDMGATARIGVSVGFACYPDDATTINTLHQGADNALYESKGAGKGIQRRFKRSRAVTDDSRTTATI